MIPVRLREQMNLTAGQVYYFSTMEENGHKYICIDCGPAISQEELEEAMRIIRANGLKISTVRPED